MLLQTKEFELRLDNMAKRDLGPKLLELLADDHTEDILRNVDGRVWTYSRGHFEYRGDMDDAQAYDIIRGVAARNDSHVSETNPIIETIIQIEEFGYPRFTGIVPPVVAGPTIAIRKRARNIYRLDDFIRQGMLTARHGEILKQAIEEKQKHVVIGGVVGCGKTTFVNACIQHIVERCPNDRLVLIEDTTELQCPVGNHSALLAVGDMTMQKCVQVTMRLKPVRIIVGEVRGGEALAMIMAWNTGHGGGLATIHAESAVGALVRIQMLMAFATPAPMQTVIADTVGLVAVMVEDRSVPAGRRVRELARVKGYENGRYMVEAL